MCEVGVMDVRWRGRLCVCVVAWFWIGVVIDRRINVAQVV